MPNPAQVKFDDDASAGLWVGSLIILLVFGWPWALAFFIIKLLLGSITIMASWGNSYRSG